MQLMSRGSGPEISAVAREKTSILKTENKNEKNTFL